MNTSFIGIMYCLMKGKCKSNLFLQSKIGFQNWVDIVFLILVSVFRTKKWDVVQRIQWVNYGHWSKLLQSYLHGDQYWNYHIMLNSCSSIPAFGTIEQIRLIESLDTNTHFRFEWRSEREKSFEEVNQIFLARILNNTVLSLSKHI